MDQQIYSIGCRCRNYSTKSESLDKIFFAYRFNIITNCFSKQHIVMINKEQSVDFLLFGTYGTSDRSHKTDPWCQGNGWIASQVKSLLQESGNTVATSFARLEDRDEVMRLVYSPDYLCSCEWHIDLNQPQWPQTTLTQPCHELCWCTRSTQCWLVRGPQGRDCSN